MSVNNNAIDIFDMNLAQEKYDVLIIGLGKTGYACAKYLSQKNIHFAVMDNRQTPPLLESMQQKLPECQVFVGKFDESIILNTKQIIISPGVSLLEPAIQKAMQNNIPVISDVELFCQHVSTPIIAVTGSNGKSTVVTLLAKVIESSGLKVGLGGNIGTPVLDLIAETEPDVYVLELSSFQLETTYSLNAKASVVLNVSEDHMDRYPDIQTYANTKAKIYNGDGLVILNRDDPLVKQTNVGQRKAITFGSSQPNKNHYGLKEINKRIALMKGGQHLLYTDELKIQGQHNAINVLAILALSEVLELNNDKVIEAIKDFPGLAHRCEWVAKINNANWYNDSKGTNVGATLAAINGLTNQNNLILIAGGVGKDANFSPLKTVANKIKLLIVFGQDGQLIADAFSGTIDIVKANDLKQCVQLAYESAASNDVVLFSPACASFDMFRNYEERGSVFVKFVNELKGHDDE